MNGTSTWEPFKTALPATEQVHRWFGAGRHNYAVVVGWQNLIVLDFDNTEQYRRWLLWAVRQGALAREAALNAFRVSTSRGVHVYLRLFQLERRNRKVGEIDIKMQGYVLGPGSTHPSGAIYTPLTSAWKFPLIRTLSDVLPVDLLLHTEQPPGVTTPVRGAAAGDSWRRLANRSQLASSGLVARIRQMFQIEDFFPNLQRPSSDGRWGMTRCPLHDDNNPSMWVDIENQICGCFAGCTPKPLDVINLYARLNGLNNDDAIRVLGERL